MIMGSINGKKVWRPTIPRSEAPYLISDRVGAAYLNPDTIPLGSE